MWNVEVKNNSFKITFRFNRYADYYDFDGDWGFFTENIDEDKEQFYTLNIPLTTDEW